MLDDQNYIAQFDHDDALGVVAGQFAQLKQQFQLDNCSATKFDGLVVAGMGGSALAASFLEVWPTLNIPVQVVRDYQLPAWVGERTLVIGSSYSGNTEETVAVLEQAAERGATRGVIAAGGRLAEVATADGLPFAELPAGLQPRMAPFYNLKALVSLLDTFGLSSGAAAELEALADRLQAVTKTWTAEVPLVDNQAKQIAEHLAGKTPIIYGSLLYPAAYKWKINFNENAKNTAWCGRLPEFNHNEFLGWSSHPIQKPFGVIDLISSFDHPQVQKRFEISDRLLSGMRPKAMVIQAEGQTPLEQLLWVVALGDMASLYLAFLNGLNPTPVELIEKMKKLL